MVKKIEDFKDTDSEDTKKQIMKVFNLNLLIFIDYK